MTLPAWTAKREMEPRIPVPMFSILDSVLYQMVDGDQNVLREAEKILIAEALRRTNYVQRAAARLLGITPKMIYHKIGQYWPVKNGGKHEPITHSPTQPSTAEGRGVVAAVQCQGPSCVDLLHAADAGRAGRGIREGP